MSEKDKDQHFDPYELDRLGKVSTSLKVNVVKWWCAGAIMYLFGIAMYMLDVLDYMFLIMFVNGLSYEYIIKNIVKVFEPRKDYRVKYLPFEKAGVKSLFLMQLYSMYLMFGFLTTWGLISYTLDVLFGVGAIGTEPITFGLITLLCDIIGIFVIRKVTLIIKKTRGKKE